MTWTFAAQLAAYAGAVCAFALAVGRWLAWDFDRKWGREAPQRDPKSGPAE